ncbi:MAG: hypothetical protein KDM81_18115, partial [Verrucomicrobiae bacterium]|nr:hypothetical protein [Verrucomicrobiae bacterium]
GNNLERFIADNIGRELKAGNFQKWKTLYTRREQINFERVAGHYLADFGYETTVDSPRPLSAAERLYWGMDHLVRKGTDLEAWKDTLYRASLRLKQILPFRSAR